MVFYVLMCLCIWRVCVCMVIYVRYVCTFVFYLCGMHVMCVDAVRMYEMYVR